MMAPGMNRHLRPFGLKLGPLSAGAIYFPLHFLAVGIGTNLLIAPNGVGVFWPAAGTLFAFLLLYPVRYWTALFLVSFAAEIVAHPAIRARLTGLAAKTTYIYRVVAKNALGTTYGPTQTLTTTA